MWGIVEGSKSERPPEGRLLNLVKKGFLRSTSTTTSHLRLCPMPTNKTMKTVKTSAEDGVAPAPQKARTKGTKRGEYPNLYRHSDHACQLTSTSNRTSTETHKCEDPKGESRWVGRPGSSGYRWHGHCDPLKNKPVLILVPISDVQKPQKRGIEETEEVPARKKGKGK